MEKFTKILSGLAATVLRNLIEVVFTSRPLVLQEDAWKFASFFTDQDYFCRRRQKYLRLRFNIFKIFFTVFLKNSNVNNKVDPPEPDVYGSCPNSEDIDFPHSRWLSVTFYPHSLCHRGLRACLKIARILPLSSLQTNHFVGTLVIPISANSYKDIFKKHNIK